MDVGLPFPAASFPLDVIDLLFVPLLEIGILELYWWLSLALLFWVGEVDFLNTKGDKDLGDDPTDPPVDLRESLDIRFRVDLSIDAVPLVLSTSLESLVTVVSLLVLSPFNLDCARVAGSIVDMVVHDADIPSA